jgi:hypothetical protein
MRVALYLILIVVLTPYALLAGGFVLLDHVIADGTLGSMLKALLRVLVWLIDGGLLVVAALLLGLLIPAASDRWRWIGFACLCLIALGSAAVIVCLSSTPLEVGQWLFLVPCLLAAAGSAWLARVEWRDRSRSAPTMPSALPQGPPP